MGSTHLLPLSKTGICGWNNCGTVDRRTRHSTYNENFSHWWVASAGRRTCYTHPKSRNIEICRVTLVTLANGQQVTLNKTGSIQVLDVDGRIIDDYPVPAGALLHFKDQEEVVESTLLAQWDPYNIPILSEKKGVIGFEDMLPGVTTKVEKDACGKSMVVIEHKEDLNPQIIVKDTSEKHLLLTQYLLVPVAVDEGTGIDAGSIIAKISVRLPKHRTLLVVCLALLNYLKQYI